MDATVLVSIGNSAAETKLNNTSTNNMNTPQNKSDCILLNIYTSLEIALSARQFIAKNYSVLKMYTYVNCRQRLIKIYISTSTATAKVLIKVALIPNK